MATTLSLKDFSQRSVFLVVDDLQANLHLIEQTIKHQLEGAKVLTTSDPVEGLAICLECLPDIVLLDLFLPGTAGLEMCYQINSIEQTSKIPIILMSGHNVSAEIKAEGYEAGACDFISKPIEQLELVAKVKSVLKSKWNKERLENLNKQLKNEVREQKSVERNLIMAKELAENANFAKTEFFSMVSHELRSHLQAINSYSKLGLKNTDSMPLNKHKTYYENIRTNSRKLIDLLNDLLDLSKMEFAKMDYTKVKTDILPIVNTVISIFQSLLEEKELTVTIDICSRDTFLVIDGLRIEQVISNLIANAIRFSPLQESIDIVITDRNDHLNGESIEALSLSIYNKGPKIKEKELTSIFEKFSQSRERADKSSGTGLGLAICNEIIKAHKGKIWAENDEEKGVTFQVLIPRTQDFLE